MDDFDIKDGSMVYTSNEGSGPGVNMIGDRVGDSVFIELSEIEDLIDWLIRAKEMLKCL